MKAAQDLEIAYPWDHKRIAFVSRNMHQNICAALAAAFLLTAGCEGGGIFGTGGERISPAQLQEMAGDANIRAFYERIGWKTVWTDELSRQLETALAEADRHALAKSAFLPDAPEDQSEAAREINFTKAALAYADALANGFVTPQQIWKIFEHQQHRVDLIGGLAQAIEGGGVDDWLANLAPHDAEYKALSDAYLEYLKRVSSERRQAIAAGGATRPGEQDPRIPHVVEALRLDGYLPQDFALSGNPALYSEPVVQAVRRMQAEHGLDASGLLGEDTVAILNTGAAERARTLAVNLERRRWLDRTPADTRIDVNTAATFLAYWRDGSLAYREIVVVGQPEWETPQLTSPIVRLVANPNWTVPKSIAEEEILPKGPGYMARNNMVMKDGWIVQQPGPKSALGLVKFDMANRHAIYLHDTPAKSLFGRADRHLSHGCVRVRNAVEFARMIARDDGVLDRFEKAMATGDETPVTLSEPIPVRLLYHTAFLDDGRVRFRPDPYGWDDELAKALGFTIKISRKVHSHFSDFGP